MSADRAAERVSGEAPDAPPQLLPALALDALVQRHAGGFGRVHAAGDWSDAEFRRHAGPLLLAFARQVHLLPAAPGRPPGSTLDAGLACVADALLHPPATAAPGGRGARLVAGGGGAARAERLRLQCAQVLHTLAPLLARSVARWRVTDLDGSEFDLLARPLLDQLAERAGEGRQRRLPARTQLAAPTAYRIEPRASPVPEPSPVAVRALHGVGALLLVRQAPGSLVRLLADPDPQLLAWACGASAAGVAASGPGAVDGAGTDAAGTDDAATGEAAGLDVGRRLPPAAAAAWRIDLDAVRSAMQRLIAGGQWTLNRRRARLWYRDGALYLVWKTAAKELASLLAAGPRQSVDWTALLDAMAAAGIVRPARPDDRATSGLLRAISTPYTEALEVVELADAQRWLQWLPEPVARASDPGADAATALAAGRTSRR